VTQELPKKV
jgi:alpha-tubulin suppressor-like RCC1 family protein